MMAMPAATPQMMRTVLVDLPDAWRDRTESARETPESELGNGAASDGLARTEARRATWKTQGMDIVNRTGY